MHFQPPKCELNFSNFSQIKFHLFHLVKRDYEQVIDTNLYTNMKA